MVSLQERFDEASKVVRDDIQRREAERAALLARTQYRDGFNLRRSNNAQAFNIPTYHNDNTSDDEYCPNAKRKKRKAPKDDNFQEVKAVRKANTKRKRKPLPDDRSQDEEDASRKLPSKRSRKNAKQDEEEIVEPTASGSFISLKLESAAGRALLTNVREESGCTEQRSRRKGATKKSQWEEDGGGLQHAHKTDEERRIDFEVAMQLKELREAEQGTRTLRSGKVRKALIPKKRQQEESNDDSGSKLFVGLGDISLPIRKRKRVCDEEDDIVVEDTRNKIRNIRNQTRRDVDQPSKFHDPVKATLPRHLNKSTGTTMDDAIYLDSSSDEDDPRIPNHPSLVFLPKHKPTSFATTASSSKMAQSIENTPSTSGHAFNAADNYTNKRTEPSSIGSDARICTLETRFSHPINFKSATLSKCDFHNNYRFGIYGHGFVTAQYLISASKPSQWIELGSGHREKQEPDTMCVACALNYLQKARCETHTFKDIDFTREQQWALNNMARQYCDDMKDKPREGHTLNMKELAPVCNLCCHPAMYECCSAQLEDRLLRPCALPDETIEAARERVGKAQLLEQTSPQTAVEVSKIDVQPAMSGCGLVLCYNCHELVDGYGGKMQANRKKVLDWITGKAPGSRADIEFHFREGLVWKAYNVDRADGDDL